MFDVSALSPLFYFFYFTLDYLLGVFRKITGNDNEAIGRQTIITFINYISNYVIGQRVHYV